jgi:hypothetical protein
LMLSQFVRNQIVPSKLHQLKYHSAKSIAV